MMAHMSSFPSAGNSSADGLLIIIFFNFGFFYCITLAIYVGIPEQSVPQSVPAPPTGRKANVTLALWL